MTPPVGEIVEVNIFLRLHVGNWQKLVSNPIKFCSREIQLIRLIANHSPYELVFGRKPKLLLDLEMDPDVKVSGMYREYSLP